MPIYILIKYRYYIFTNEVDTIFGKERRIVRYNCFQKIYGQLIKSHILGKPAYIGE